MRNTKEADLAHWWRETSSHQVTLWYRSAIFFLFSNKNPARVDKKNSDKTFVIPKMCRKKNAKLAQRFSNFYPDDFQSVLFFETSPRISR